MGALTDVAVSKASPGNARREIPDGEYGLFLVVQPSGAKSWAIRYRFNGIPKKHTLGSYPGVTLKAARSAAKQALGKIAGGVDPASKRKQEKAEAHAAAEKKRSDQKDVTENVVAEFVSRYAKKNNKRWQEAERILQIEVAGTRKDKPPAPWTGKPITAIAKRDVHDLLDRIVDRGAPIMANRTFSTLRRMCSWAVERGILTISPCEGLKAPAAEHSRDRILDDEELKLAWNASDEIGWPYGAFVQMLILTAQRRGEVAGMRWAEVDLKARIWTIPAERAKNGIEHVVPLSDQAVAMLNELPKIKHGRQGSLFVFTKDGLLHVNGFSTVKEKLDARILRALREVAEDAEAPPPWTFHDLRRTATSGMARLGVAPHVADAVLNHKSGAIQGVAKIYNRYKYEPEKAAALATWGRFVEALVSGKPASNILEMRALG